MAKSSVVIMPREHVSPLPQLSLRRGNVICDVFSNFIASDEDDDDDDDGDDDDDDDDDDVDDDELQVAATCRKSKHRDVFECYLLDVRMASFPADGKEWQSECMYVCMYVCMWSPPPRANLSSWGGGHHTR